jgi:hypothetical protein
MESEMRSDDLARLESRTATLARNVANELYEVFEDMEASGRTEQDVLVSKSGRIRVIGGHLETKADRIRTLRRCLRRIYLIHVKIKDGLVDLFILYASTFRPNRMPHGWRSEDY